MRDIYDAVNCPCIVCKKWRFMKDHLKIPRILLAVISRTPIRFHVKWRRACLFSRNEVDKAGHIVQKWQTSADKPRMYRDACNKRANDYNISVVNNEHAGQTQILPLFGSRITRLITRKYSSETKNTSKRSSPVHFIPPPSLPPRMYHMKQSYEQVGRRTQNRYIFLEMWLV